MNPYFAAKLGAFFYVFGGVTSTITFVVSVLSWTLIPKWRIFKNYVFLNIIFAFTALFFLPMLLLLTSDFYKSYGIWYICLDIAINYFNFAACCWLAVLAMVFYSDIVKVFRSDTTRKFLKSNSFAWGLPTVVTAVKIFNKIFMHESGEEITYNDIFHPVYYYEEIFQYVLLIALLVANFLTYIKVVYSLMKPSKIRRSKENKCQKIQVATLAFVMSGVLLMISILMMVMMTMSLQQTYIYYPMSLMLTGLQTTVINTCFLISKGNRKLWYDFYKSKTIKDDCLQMVNKNVNS